MKRPYKICTRCVMDTSDEDIYFDSSGFCNHCNRHHFMSARFGYRRHESDYKLAELVKKIKYDSRKRDYDCVVGVSGGVDSSYVAMICKEIGFRALLVHFDNGWNSEVAVSNINKIVRRLDYDYITEVVDWPSFRDVQLSILRSGSVDLEYPTDLGIFKTVMEAARKNHIKYVISGTNLASEGMLPLTWGYHRYRDVRYFQAIVGSYVKKLSYIPHYSLLEETILRVRYRIQTIALLNFISFSRDLAKEQLADRLGWSDYGGKHAESRITAFWQGYVMNKRFGFDYRRPTLSAEICSGLRSRDDALSILEVAPIVEGDFDETNRFVAKKFGLSMAELSELIHIPPKTYKDFPNSKALIDFVHATYRRIFQ